MDNSSNNSYEYVGVAILFAIILVAIIVIAAKVSSKSLIPTDPSGDDPPPHDPLPEPSDPLPEPEPTPLHELYNVGEINYHPEETDADGNIIPEHMSIYTGDSLFKMFPGDPIEIRSGADSWDTSEPLHDVDIINTETGESYTISTNNILVGSSWDESFRTDPNKAAPIYLSSYMDVSSVYSDEAASDEGLPMSLYKFINGVDPDPPEYTLELSNEGNISDPTWTITADLITTKYTYEAVDENGKSQVTTETYEIIPEIVPNSESWNLTVLPFSHSITLKDPHTNKVHIYTSHDITLTPELSSWDLDSESPTYTEVYMCNDEVMQNLIGNILGEPMTMSKTYSVRVDGSKEARENWDVQEIDAVSPGDTHTVHYTAFDHDDEFNEVTIATTQEVLAVTSVESSEDVSMKNDSDPTESYRLNIGTVFTDEKGNTSGGFFSDESFPASITYLYNTLDSSGNPISVEFDPADWPIDTSTYADAPITNNSFTITYDYATADALGEDTTKVPPTTVTVGDFVLVSDGVFERKIQISDEYGNSFVLTNPVNVSDEYGDFEDPMNMTHEYILEDDVTGDIKTILYARDSVDNPITISYPKTASLPNYTIDTANLDPVSGAPRASIVVTFSHDNPMTQTASTVDVTHEYSSDIGTVGKLSVENIWQILPSNYPNLKHTVKISGPLSADPTVYESDLTISNNSTVYVDFEVLTATYTFTTDASAGYSPALTHNITIPLTEVESPCVIDEENLSVEYSISYTDEYNITYEAGPNNSVLTKSYGYSSGSDPFFDFGSGQILGTSYEFSTADGPCTGITYDINYNGSTVVTGPEPDIDYPGYDENDPNAKVYQKYEIRVGVRDINDPTDTDPYIPPNMYEEVGAAPGFKDMVSNVKPGDVVIISYEVEDATGLHIPRVFTLYPGGGMERLRAPLGSIPSDYYGDIFSVYSASHMDPNAQNKFLYDSEASKTMALGSSLDASLDPHKYSVHGPGMMIERFSSEDPSGFVLVHRDSNNNETISVVLGNDGASDRIQNIQIGNKQIISIDEATITNKEIEIVTDSSGNTTKKYYAYDDIANDATYKYSSVEVVGMDGAPTIITTVNPEGPGFEINAMDIQYPETKHMISQDVLNDELTDPLNISTNLSTNVIDVITPTDQLKIDTPSPSYLNSSYLFDIEISIPDPHINMDNMHIVSGGDPENENIIPVAGLSVKKYLDQSLLYSYQETAEDLSIINVSYLLLPILDDVETGIDEVTQEPIMESIMTSPLTSDTTIRNYTKIYKQADESLHLYTGDSEHGELFLSYIMVSNEVISNPEPYPLDTKFDISSDKTLINIHYYENNTNVITTTIDKNKLSGNLSTEILDGRHKVPYFYPSSMQVDALINDNDTDKLIDFNMGDSKYDEDNKIVSTIDLSNNILTTETVETEDSEGNTINVNVLVQIIFKYFTFTEYMDPTNALGLTIGNTSDSDYIPNKGLNIGDTDFNKKANLYTFIDSKGIHKKSEHSTITPKFPLNSPSENFTNTHFTEDGVTPLPTLLKVKLIGGGGGAGAPDFDTVHAANGTGGNGAEIEYVLEYNKDAEYMIYVGWNGHKRGPPRGYLSTGGPTNGGYNSSRGGSGGSATVLIGKIANDYNHPDSTIENNEKLDNISVEQITIPSPYTLQTGTTYNVDFTSNAQTITNPDNSTSTGNFMILNNDYYVPLVVAGGGGGGGGGFAFNDKDNNKPYKYMASWDYTSNSISAQKKGCIIRNKYPDLDENGNIKTDSFGNEIYHEVLSYPLQGGGGDNDSHISNHNSEIAKITMTDPNFLMNGETVTIDGNTVTLSSKEQNPAYLDKIGLSGNWIFNHELVNRFGEMTTWRWYKMVHTTNYVEMLPHHVMRSAILVKPAIADINKRVHQLEGNGQRGVVLSKLYAMITVTSVGCSAVNKNITGCSACYTGAGGGGWVGATGGRFYNYGGGGGSSYPLLNNYSTKTMNQELDSNGNSLADDDGIITYNNGVTYFRHGLTIDKYGLRKINSNDILQNGYNKDVGLIYHKSGNPRANQEQKKTRSIHGYGGWTNDGSALNNPNGTYGGFGYAKITWMYLNPKYK